MYMLFQEREAWEEKEQEYLQKIDEITNNHLRAIEIEKVRFMRHATRRYPSYITPPGRSKVLY